MCVQARRLGPAARSRPCPCPSLTSSQPLGLTSLLPPSRATAFLLTNGYAYLAAHSLVLVEYTLERAFYPELKCVGWWTYVGLAIVLFGQLIRTLAMVHASASFSHHIAVMKKSDHVLVTSGVYACVAAYVERAVWLSADTLFLPLTHSYARHPSYFAYFWWAVGSQVMVANPVMAVLFAGYLWRWFFQRIGGASRPRLNDCRGRALTDAMPSFATQTRSAYSSSSSARSTSITAKRLSRACRSCAKAVEHSGV